MATRAKAEKADEALSEALALAEALRPLLHRLLRQLRRESTAPNVTPPQGMLLATIVEQPGIGIGELARLEKLRGPTVSEHVKAMTALGLVERAAPDARDKRRVGLVATKKGRGVIEAAKRRRTDWLARRLAGLEPDARAAIGRAIGPLGEIAQ